jgi:hypothetical protein
MHESKRSYLLHLSSDGNDGLQGNNPQRFRSDILEEIVVKDNETAYVSVRHAKIPNSVSQVKDLSMEIRTLNDNVLHLLQIKNGTYNGNQIAAELKRLIGITSPLNLTDQVTVVYDPVDGRLTFDNLSTIGIQLEFTDIQVANLFGFLLGNYAVPSGSQLTSSKAVDLFPIPEIYLHSNLNLSHTYYNKKRGQDQIVEIFPIANIPYGTEMFFSNQNTEFRSRFTGRIINYIELWLEDYEGNEIVFDDTTRRYEISLLIQIEPKNICN